MTSPDTDRSRQRGRVTLEDVAQEAAVSKATASRVLNGGPRTVGEEHRRRVLAAAERLGYQADLLAQATSKGTTPTVALVVGDIRDPYCAGIARGVIDRSASENLVVTVSGSSASAGDELAVLRALRGQAPRVTILATPSHHVASSRKRLVTALRTMSAGNGRVVVIGREGLPFDTVTTDDRLAAGQLVAALASRGYRAPLVLAGRSDLELARQREEGLRDGLTAAGIALPGYAVIRCTADRAGAYDAVSAMRPQQLATYDVVICGNDLMAVGAMSALRGHGLRPGTDIGVTGFDDVPAAMDMHPALTTVRVPLRALGVSAMELALDGTGQSPRIVRHELTVALRESTPAKA